MSPSNLSSLSNLFHITWVTSPYPVAWPSHLLWVINNNTLQVQKKVMGQEIGERGLSVCFPTNGNILRHDSSCSQVTLLGTVCQKQGSGWC